MCACVRVCVCLQTYIYILYLKHISYRDSLEASVQFTSHQNGKLLVSKLMRYTMAATSDPVNGPTICERRREVGDSIRREENEMYEQIIA